MPLTGCCTMVAPANEAGTTYTRAGIGEYPVSITSPSRLAVTWIRNSPAKGIRSAVNSATPPDSCSVVTPCTRFSGGWSQAGEKRRQEETCVAVTFTVLCEIVITSQLVSRKTTLIRGSRGMPAVTTAGKASSESVLIENTHRNTMLVV
eukprot:1612983-Rhodomonas_salina.6